MAKFHTSIGSARALCGRNAARNRVISNLDFAAAHAECRCRRCAQIYTRHGYRLEHNPRRAGFRAATYASHTAEAV